MTTTLGEPEILKVDTRRRVRLPREKREALLDEFERSGVSGARFAGIYGIKYQTFANWMQKRRKERKKAGVEGTSGGGEEREKDGAVRWLEAVGTREVAIGGTATGRRMGGATSLRIELAGGMRMEISHPSQINLAAELLRVLAHGSSR